MRGSLTCSSQPLARPKSKIALERDRKRRWDWTNKRSSLARQLTVAAQTNRQRRLVSARPSTKMTGRQGQTRDSSVGSRQAGTPPGRAARPERAPATSAPPGCLTSRNLRLISMTDFLVSDGWRPCGSGRSQERPRELPSAQLACPSRRPIIRLEKFKMCLGPEKLRGWQRHRNNFSAVVHGIGRRRLKWTKLNKAARALDAVEAFCVQCAS